MGTILSILGLIGAIAGIVFGLILHGRRSGRDEAENKVLKQEQKVEDAVSKASAGSPRDRDELDSLLSDPDRKL